MIANRFVPSLLLLALVCAAPAAQAQIVIVGTDFAGELSVDDEQAFRDSLQRGLERSERGTIVSEQAAVTALGDAASCREASCMTEVAAQMSANVTVVADVYAEAEIYDFNVRIFDAATGEQLVNQVGDCTFCPVAEALDAFSFTAEAALSSLPALPSAAVAAQPAESAAPEPTTIAVLTVPETATIRIDGVEVGADGRYRETFEPGSYTVEVDADGYSPYEERVSVSEAMAGTQIFLRVVLARTAPEAAPAPAPQVEEVVRTGLDARTLARRRAAGGVAIGTGVALTAVGATLLALDGNDTCPTGAFERCPSVYDTAAGGGALVGVGAAGIGVGIGLLATTAGGATDGTQARLGTDGRRVWMRLDF